MRLEACENTISRTIESLSGYSTVSGFVCMVERYFLFEVGLSCIGQGRVCPSAFILPRGRSVLADHLSHELYFI